MTLSQLLEKIDIVPNKKELFYNALTHSSFVNETGSGESYQRLEFVGDALIDKEAALFLFYQNSELHEGDMTVIRSNAVNARRLAKHALDLKLHEIMRVGKGADELRNNVKVQSDLFEALCAAIYIDVGVEKLRNFLKFNVFQDLINANGVAKKNPKTVLQEFLQAESRENIEYHSFEYNDHFVSEVIHSGMKLGTGEGNTKKEAEIKAAKSALKKMSKG